ncbi:MAG: hypothetical protein L0Z73_09410 [Gammaproteobacteria bacterium]|nr:hypothetical protein [Gammaproteobacteria bacterium]
MRRLIAAACGVCCWISTAAADSTIQFKIDGIELGNIPHIEIKPGYYGEIAMDAAMLDLGQGPVPVYLYQLPEYKTSKQLLLTTVVEKKRVFSPIVVLLTDRYEPAAVVSGDISLHRVNQAEVSSTIPITILPNHRYMLITTNPKILGKQLSYKRMNTGIVKMFDGNNTQYVPVTTGMREENVVIADSGRLVLSAPHQDY